MIRIDRILCPIDFSPCSRRALDHATALAAWYGAGVTALYVHRLATPVLAAGPFIGLEALQPMALSDSERVRLMALLDQFVADDRKAGIRIETILDERLDIPAAVVARARSSGADLIVLGTHGRSGVERFVLGSVTERVLRKAPCPVLAVPPRTPEAVEAPVSYQRILCPIDFSAGSTRALEYAASMASDVKAELTVLHIVDVPPDADPPHPGLTAYRAARFEQARQDVADALVPVRQVCSPRELILAGRPDKEILRVAAEQSVDLIVMGVRGRSMVDILLFGSVTQQVVRQAECPVLAL